MNTATTAVVVSLVTSSSVALCTGLFSGRTERRKQLLESRRVVAGDFCEETMAALAQFRHIKPIKSDAHRNATLRQDMSERTCRIEIAETAVDRVRRLRGRVWLTFPGRSPTDQSPTTTSDWAEDVIAQLRRVEETCGEFWLLYDKEVTEGGRRRLEEQYDQRYDHAKGCAWNSLNSFADAASACLAQSFSFSRNLPR